MPWADRHHVKHPKERLVDGVLIVPPFKEASGTPSRGRTELSSGRKVTNPPGQSQQMYIFIAILYTFPPRKWRQQGHQPLIQLPDHFQVVNVQGLNDYQQPGTQEQ